MADVDGDGWLDIYVTNIYNETEDRPDLLFINQRDPELRLSERAAEHGVEDDGFYGIASNESHSAIFADLSKTTATSICT